MHLSALKTMHVMQAGTDGAEQEEGVVKDTPAAAGALTGQHALVKSCMVRYTHLFSSRCLSCCLMLVNAGIMGLASACLYFYRSAMS